jgi:UDP-N-acetylmuramyl pentapeptide synthase
MIALGELAKEITGAEHVESPHDAAARAFARTKSGDWILLKASRGMRLERVLDAMRQASEASVVKGLGGLVSRAEPGEDPR